MKKVFTAVMIVMVFCSCACAAAWTDNAGQWASGAWKATTDNAGQLWEATKEYIARGIQWVSDKWNGSDSKKIDKLSEEVSDIKKMLAALMHAQGNVQASRFDDASHFEDDERRAELDAISADLAAMLSRLHEMSADLAAERAERHRLELERQREALTLASRDAELAERNAELTERERKLQQDEQAAGASRERARIAEQQAAKFYAMLSKDVNLRKFIKAGMLGRIDTDSRGVNYQSGVNIYNTPYNTLTVNDNASRYGFIDADALKRSIKGLFRDNMRVWLSDNKLTLELSDDKVDLASQINTVSTNAFFTLDGVASELDNAPRVKDTVASDIAAFLKANDLKGRLRVFFRTRHVGLYVLAVFENENLAPRVFLAADTSQKLIDRSNLLRELRRSINAGDIGSKVTLSLTDDRLDAYLDQFVKELLDRISAR